LEEEVRHNLDRYAEFIDANASYVVSEALKLLFRKDEDFKRWLGQQADNRIQQQPKGEALTRTA
jgi:predicted transcriptional regulator